MGFLCKGDENVWIKEMDRSVLEERQRAVEYELDDDIIF